MEKNKKVIHVFYTEINRKMNLNSFKEEIRFLPTWMQKRIENFKFEIDALANLFGKLLILYSLKFHNVSYLDLFDLKINEYGKPFFDTNDFHFNISHSNKFVVCATDVCAPVGIDIEEIRPISVQDFFSVFTEDEVQEIVSSSDLKKFYELWTLKEAVIKAEGMGFFMPTKNIIVSKSKKAAKTRNNIWKIKTIPIDKKYSCTIAMKSKSMIYLHEVTF